AVHHAGAGRVREEDFVTWIQRSQEHVQEALRAARGDDALLIRVIGDAAQPGHVTGYRFPQPSRTDEREVAVGVILVNGAPGRLQRGFRRPQVSIQVLQAQHVWIRPCRGCYTIDGEWWIVRSLSFASRSMSLIDRPSFCAARN